MNLIGEAHVMLHEKGIPRIHTDIRVGSRQELLGVDESFRTPTDKSRRVDKEQSFEDKVDVVNKLLAKDGLLEDEQSESTSEQEAKK